MKRKYSEMGARTERRPLGIYGGRNAQKLLRARAKPEKPRKARCCKNGVLRVRNVPLQVYKRRTDGFEACHVTFATEKQ
jgi:hypothetical protein